MAIPSSTYRLQLHGDFAFDDATAQVDYLDKLGISHIYASPYLQAVPGSRHGYDVVDHTLINEELGGEKAYTRLFRELRKKKMGIVMDIVPNHMAIHGPENKWWWDVLENGPSSSYSTYFDVDWEYPQDRPDNKVLLPILGDHYGKVLEKGEIFCERRENRFLIRYYDYIFPAAPKSLIEILMPVANKSKSDELGFVVSALHYLPNPDLTERVKTRRRRRDKGILISILDRIITEQPAVRRLIDEEIELLNSDSDRMDRFIDLQNYRLAFWKLARTDLGYRRFFNINNLVALRMEDEEVFADTHELVFRLIEEKKIDGLRVDHPDGLRDPEVYFIRLRGKAPDLWVIAEKILHRGESLPRSWPVHGTTGYDFLNYAGGLYVDPGGESLLDGFYSRFTGEQRDYATILYEKKKMVMKEILASDVNRLTEQLFRLCGEDRMYRDFIREEVKATIVEYIALLPVYRTYVRDSDGNKVSDIDRKMIDETIARAKKMREDIDPLLFDFLNSIVLLETGDKEAKEFALSLQQMSGPVMAKGAEDTAFYCYNRFVMLNEVGGDPGIFGTAVESFHRYMTLVSEEFPHTMTTTSTHDTKRSEDVRARLAVISEIPDKWTMYVINAAQNNEGFRKDGIPDRNMEYLLYQTIVGAWPITAERLAAFTEKAAREAKIHSSWAQPDSHYEEVCREFIETILNNETFLEYTRSFVSEISTAGRINSLSQTLLKLTAPGVPDIYQGTELWDLSLVDPDNRRAVDFRRRMEILGECEAMKAEEVMDHIDNGHPKLWLIYKTLNVRKEHPEYFHNASYKPAEVKGGKSDHVVAFMRGENCITVVPRLIKKNGGLWDDTEIKLGEGRWKNVYDGRLYGEGFTSIAEIFRDFPVAFLVREKEGGGP
ncbi:MAG: malto-oligosyltrehalose synthase [Spirochaetales bacterium]|nr:malto-oligosyltrehalose synthase [Spirochaetales bacterium]